MKKVTKVFMIIVAVAMSTVYTANAQVSINSDGSAPDDSAMLDVESTDKGMLIPRVALTGTSDVATISSPAVSLMVYNTATAGDVTPGFYYWNGSAWTNLFNQGGSHYLGEEYLDGIIFYLYIGSNGLQHGLVVSKTETTATWSGSTLVVNADRTEDGEYNTLLMPNGTGSARYWVQNTLNGGATVNTPWYIPSMDELSLLWHNRFHVNTTARATPSTLLSNNSRYWSSTEYHANAAFFFNFYGGYAHDYGHDHKTNTYRVRGVRSF